MRFLYIISFVSSNKTSVSNNLLSSISSVFKEFSIAIQKLLISSQRENKCSRVSFSVLPKLHNGESFLSKLIDCSISQAWLKMKSRFCEKQKNNNNQQYFIRTSILSFTRKKNIIFHCWLVCLNFESNMKRKYRGIYVRKCLGTKWP